MRLRHGAIGSLLLAVGCLVPRYDYEPAGATGGTGGATSGGSAGSSAAGAGAKGGSAGGAGCGAGQKECGGACVAVDDPAYGCTATSCDQLGCPVAGEGTLACEGGACVVGSCGAGSKMCEGKCVSIDDPTYGCSETGCDDSSCPEAGSATVICNQGACELGACTGATKNCAGKCVPTDRNNGCNDPTSCEACGPTEACGPGNATCECLPVDPCSASSCGELFGRCGEKVDCGGCVEGVCDVDNTCKECLEHADCAPSTNVCVVRSCNASQQCSESVAGAQTFCPGEGFCSAVHIGRCERPVVSIGGNYDIDAAEVTRGEYETFLRSASFPPSGFPPACSWKTGFTNQPNIHDPDAEASELPVTFVDWCDAWGYCNYVGRRLCGKLGGGSTPYNDFDEPAVSQWTNACAGPNLDAFPYGDVAEPGACHDYSGPGVPLAVGSFTRCEGGYPDLYDMTGSLREWEDSCNGAAGPTNLCRARGGSFTSGENLAADASCTAATSFARSHKSGDVGFRCCSK